VEGIILQAEIEYQKPDGTWVHSDIEPRGCKFKDLDAEHREYLHGLLDEWIDKSRGTGCFYIKNERFEILNQEF
jgi:hypothetical protein